jgi:hypothetical protein
LVRATYADSCLKVNIITHNYQARLASRFPDATDRAMETSPEEERVLSPPGGGESPECLGAKIQGAHAQIADFALRSGWSALK